MASREVHVLYTGINYVSLMIPQDACKSHLPVVLFYNFP